MERFKLETFASLGMVLANCVTRKVRIGHNTPKEQANTVKTIGITNTVKTFFMHPWYSTIPNVLTQHRTFADKDAT